jgi:hypothetical protein
MESVTPASDHVGMGLLMNIVAGVAGILMVVIGVYSMIAIWWDELG